MPLLRSKYQQIHLIIVVLNHLYCIQQLKLLVFLLKVIVFSNFDQLIQGLVRSMLLDLLHQSRIHDLCCFIHQLCQLYQEQQSQYLGYSSVFHHIVDGLNRDKIQELKDKYYIMDRQDQDKVQQQELYNQDVINPALLYLQQDPNIHNIKVQLQGHSLERWCMVQQHYQDQEQEQQNQQKQLYHEPTVLVLHLPI